MTNQEKLAFYSGHKRDIFLHPSNNIISFIVDSLDETKILDLLEEWPDEIKIKVVENYLNNI